MAKHEQHLEIDAQSVRVSNLHKVLYPDNKFTKAQVIDYYIRVSEYLLPHFKDHPVTLARFPDGVRGEHFYERDAPPFTPKWVKTFPVPRRAGGTPIRYVLINDLATLVWCANSASLELHPFLHRAPDIQCPASVVFDLDPGEGANVLTCAEVGFLLKDVLSRLGLECFAKVSGSKGLQIYVPLNTPASYEETQPFARKIAEFLAKQNPELIIAEMAKRERTKKVLVDWSQNSDFKTTVGVYSLRAKKGRPYVSLPVTWDELTNALHTRKIASLFWEPEAALDRLGQTGDLFAPVLSCRQHLPELAAGMLQIDSLAGRPPVPRVDVHKLPKSKMEFIEPMQCKLAARLPEGDDWEYEIKLDGYRALAIKRRNSVHLLSRRNNSLNGRFPQIAEPLAALQDGVILDGEILALDAHARPSFELLQHHAAESRAILFYVFDVLAWRERDLRSLPLHLRREILVEVLRNIEDPVRISTPLKAPAEHLIPAIKQPMTAEAMKKYKWLRPKLVAQVEFTEWSSTNRLRHSKFVALREDKNPREVTHEIAADV